MHGKWMGKRKTKNSEHTSGSEPGDNRLPTRGRGKALLKAWWGLDGKPLCVHSPWAVSVSFVIQIICDVIIIFSLFG